jgi:hypothetical protein
VIAAAKERPASESYGKTSCHQQRTEVRVADTELAVATRGVADCLSREVREGDRDVHRSDDELHALGEPISVEGVVVLEELHQVEAREVA